MRTYAPHKLDKYIIVATPHNIKRILCVTVSNEGKPRSSSISVTL